jgi:hypothetical protein
MRFGLAALTALLILSCGCLEIPDQIDLTPLKNLFAEEEPGPEPLEPAAQLYYSLKNKSCGTLSGNFLIVTRDVSQGSIEGLVEEKPGELGIAQEILDDYSLDQTTRTYVLDDQMKRVVVSGWDEHTVVWKGGRVYNCTDSSCVMRIMDQNDSEYYYDMLDRMRRRCAFFGKTELPPSVNQSLLLDFEHTGRIDTAEYRCENFLITGDKYYAEWLLDSNLSQNFTEDQKTLLWAIAHFDGPVNECLDDGTGMIAYRNLTLDLTDSYRFEYSPGGYMKVNHQTTLEHFTDNVPESFLAIPN